MDDSLYDEFGNYLGPDLEEEEDDDLELEEDNYEQEQQDDDEEADEEHVNNSSMMQIDGKSNNRSQLYSILHVLMTI